MKRVVLIRHAKSSWEDPFGDDHARPLNDRGRRNAAAMGHWVRQHAYVPDQILCSDAARTQETARLLNLGPPVTLEPSLYHAAPDTMLQLLEGSAAQSVALIGHNPGMAILARHLIADHPDHPRFGDYPTCAVTVIDFEGMIGPHTGRCTDFIIPRDLPT